ADAPPRLPPDPTELSDAEIALIELARRDPSAAADVVAGEAEACARDPLVSHSRPRTGPDAAARAQPGVPAMLERSALEAGRQGRDGAAREYPARCPPRERV